MTNCLGAENEKKIKVLKGVNTLTHQCMAGEIWYVTYLCPLGWPRSLYFAKLFLEKMGKILQSISIEGQVHIFTVDLIFGLSTCHAEGSCIQ